MSQNNNGIWRFIYLWIVEGIDNWRASNLQTSVCMNGKMEEGCLKGR